MLYKIYTSFQIKPNFEVARLIPYSLIENLFAPEAISLRLRPLLASFLNFFIKEFSLLIRRVVRPREVDLASAIAPKSLPRKNYKRIKNLENEIMRENVVEEEYFQDDFGL